MAEEKAKEHIKDLRNQVRLYRQSASFYREQFSKEQDSKNVLRHAIDTFTCHHPEHTTEIEALIEYWESMKKSH